MGQQLNKLIKRRRRKAYIERKKALARSGVARKASRVAKPAEPPAKPAAKKTVKKKVVKKAEVKPVEVVDTAAVQAPVADEVETGVEIVETPPVVDSEETQGS